MFRATFLRRAAGGASPRWCLPRARQVPKTVTRIRTLQRSRLRPLAPPRCASRGHQRRPRTWPRNSSQQAPSLMFTRLCSVDHTGVSTAFTATNMCSTDRYRSLRGAGRSVTARLTPGRDQCPPRRRAFSGQVRGCASRGACVRAAPRPHAPRGSAPRGSRTRRSEGADGARPSS